MVVSRIASRGLWLGIGAVCLLFLLFWAQLALSSRLASDDFCAAGLYRQHGLIGTVLWWRTHLTGRWFSQGLVAWTSAAFLPTGRASLYAFGFLVALWMVGIWAWNGFDCLRPNTNNRGASAVRELLVLFLVAAIFALTPVPSEVWFWVAGSGVHSVPIVALLLLVGVLARGTATTPHLLTVAIAALIVGGGSETSIVLGFFALVYGALQFKESRRRLAIVGLIGLLCSAAFALSAPGNFVRLETQTAHASLRPHDVWATVLMVSRAGLLLKWRWWLLLVGVSVALAPEITVRFPGFPRRFGLAFWIGVPLACAISLIPAMFAFHGPFPLRTLAPVTFFMTVWMNAVSVQVGIRLLEAKRVKQMALQMAGVLCSLILVVMWGGWIRKQIPIVKGAARTFDRNYVIIQASRPECKAVLRIEKPVWQRWVPIGVPEHTSSHWISKCMSGALDSCPLEQK
ncbi:hypothetical protein IAD21_04008 [Abditibacteriota bacterium]|nr:hypothetical protein IAD21_04008 [Abditibacteriota bacterium]